MGGQIGRNCLTVEQMFINGQIIRECLGAEGGALPLTLHNTYPQSYPQPVDSWQRGRAWRKIRPPCVKSDGGVIHTPTKEICAKVRSP
jgi:hypothetical protein